VLLQILRNPVMQFTFWSDLLTDCTDCGVFTSTTGTPPNRVFNIEWRAGYFKSTDTANFELRLGEGTGVFEFVYGQMSGRDNNGTVGAQRAGATFFNRYQCNAGGLNPGLVVRGIPQVCGSATVTPIVVTATRTPTLTPPRTRTSSPTSTRACYELCELHSRVEWA
jgi:hypothetical protein